MGTAESRKTVRVGVFIPADCQLLDMACVDILGTMSHDYLSIIGDVAPAPIVQIAPIIEILYISTVQPNDPIPLTSSARLLCTHHMSDAAVQPGQLDVVLVPGPDPSLDFGEMREALDWLAAHAARPETDNLSVCTGMYVCGAAGLLKGRKACGPRGLQADLARKFEGVQWVGDELRWVRDGNFWSSGGVTNGNDLVAAYARSSGRFPGPVVEFALLVTDTGDRPQRYQTGKAAMTLGVVWQILKAVWMGLGKGKSA